VKTGSVSDKMSSSASMSIIQVLWVRLQQHHTRFSWAGRPNAEKWA
jgi:hypothetical protein